MLHAGKVRLYRNTASLARALHLVRGNFASYSEERPLFGRISGLIWRPLHVSGRAQNRVVTGDRRIDPRATTDRAP